MFVQELVAQAQLNDSMWPFCQGELGSINGVEVLFNVCGDAAQADLHRSLKRIFHLQPAESRRR